ncbi:MAG TPA: lysylphosphatidylglycerol synthase transmembrane domain-containing protein [Candidatus Limnocylindrales bacterium]|nr:lysylphosphatidylglycerol synthase transmembrane domain-containing protein [Candidatus Limnocylindrales bacterium]
MGAFPSKIWQKPSTRIIISLSLLGFLLVKLPLSDLWQAIRQVSPGLWIFSILVFMMGHVLGVVKWSLLINMGKNKLPFLVAARCYFAGLFANLCLPSIAGGDIVRAAMAMGFPNGKAESRGGRPPARTEAVLLGSVLDRFLDIASLAFLMFLGIWSAPGAVTTEDRRVLSWALFFLFGFALCTLLFLLLPLPKSIPVRLGLWITRCRQIIRHLLKNPERALVGFGIATCVQGAFVLLAATLGAACGIHLARSIWFLIWPLSKLVASLPISMGGLGVREIALVTLLGRFGIPASSSVGLGLLWQTILVAGGGMGGLLYLLLKRNTSRSDVRAAWRISHKKI